MVASPERIESFIVKDCAHAAISTGRRAQNLKELHDELLGIHPGAIYYHFWGGLLRPRFDDPEFINDFAAWVRHALHDLSLAERLAIIDPAAHADIESLRQEVIAAIKLRLDEGYHELRAPPDQQFHFIRAQTIVFDSGVRAETPQALAAILPTLSVGSVYYHFIDARRRTPHGKDDFRKWLESLESCEPLCQQLADLDPYFTNLRRLREQLSEIFQGAFLN